MCIRDSPHVALRFARMRLTTPPLAGFVRQLNAGRFAGSLATLVRSDVPLVEALKASAAVTPNLYVRERALHVAQRVREGASLRRAMTEADVFPRLLLAVVSGLMITLLMIYVVPDIVKVFVNRGAELPLLTRGLIAVSSGLQRFGLPLLIVLGVAGLVLNRWLAVPHVALRFARMRLTTPPLGGFVRQLNAGRFAGSLATLVRSDVPLVEALKASAAVTPNLYVRERALHVAQRVREGASLRRAMTEADVFPRLLLAVVASGEQSGRLGPGLERAAADLEQELEGLVAAIVALVEPMVLLVMGGLVLLMVLAILLPIVNLNNLAGL